METTSTDLASGVFVLPAQERVARLGGKCKISSQPGNGIALRNVRDRLRLMHDVAAQFDVHREATFYRVQIGVPL